MTTINFCWFKHKYHTNRALCFKFFLVIGVMTTWFASVRKGFLLKFIFGFNFRLIFFSNIWKTWSIWTSWISSLTISTSSFRSLGSSRTYLPCWWKPSRRWLMLIPLKYFQSILRSTTSLLQKSSQPWWTRWFQINKFINSYFIFNCFKLVSILCCFFVCKYFFYF